MVKDLLTQFFRYTIVGGIAFIVDFSILSIVYKLILKDFAYSLFIATATGFIGGIIVNYIISKRFVFVQDTSRTKSSVFDFLMYVIIGFLGLLFTEVGIHFGVEILGCNYAVTKIVMACLVLLWNFLARRFLIYK